MEIYKGLETYSGMTTDPEAHGYHGPISVRQPQHPTTVSETFTQAIIQATGLPFVLDYNDPNTPTGASTQLQYTQSAPNGTLRVSSATAFLNESVMTPEGVGVDGRKLRVLFNSTALRICGMVKLQLVWNTYNLVKQNGCLQIKKLSYVQDFLVAHF